MAWFNPFTWTKPREADALVADTPAPTAPEPPAQKGFRFTALRDFPCPELRSNYVEGLGYTVRPGNAKLAALVDRWIDEGKVRLGAPSSRVAGRANAK